MARCQDCAHTLLFLNEQYGQLDRCDECYEKRLKPHTTPPVVTPPVTKKAHGCSFWSGFIRLYDPLKGSIK